MDIDQNFTWSRKNAASKIHKVLVEEELIMFFPNSNAFYKGRVFFERYPLSSPLPSLFGVLHHLEPLIVSWKILVFLRHLKNNGYCLEGCLCRKKIEPLKMPVRIWNIKGFGLIDKKIQVLSRRNGQARIERTSSNTTRL